MDNINQIDQFFVQTSMSQLSMGSDILLSAESNKTSKK